MAIDEIGMLHDVTLPLKIIHVRHEVKPHRHENHKKKPKELKVNFDTLDQSFIRNIVLRKLARLIYFSLRSLEDVT